MSNYKSHTASDWLDSRTPVVFVLPAVLLILGFSIFPLLVSAWMAVSRFKLIGGGYQFRFVGWLNFKKLFVGSEQFHLLGTFAAIPVIGWIILLAVAALVGLGVYRYAKDSPITVLGIVGRAISFGLVLFLAWLIVSTIGTGGQMGSLSTTIFYVTLGVLIQFVIGTGLAWLCSQNITARSFFRLVFFIPLMVTPVGIAYTFRMMVDMNVGPISPIWQALGLGQFSWSSNPWSARMVVIVGDSWQWIPFIFLVMLAAFESQPKDELEAASIDGASGLQIFRDITWPSVAPVAATVVLIRVIEAFKIIDLPNILTNGGPGIASESLTLHSFIQWRSLDLGASSAVAYVLLFVSTVICVSFFNFVVSPARRTSR